MSVDGAWRGTRRSADGSRQRWALAIGHASTPDGPLTVTFTRRARRTTVHPVSPGHREVASAGTFLVPDSGSGTFSMTSAVDPHQFRTMEIRIESPNKNGALQGTVVLRGQAKV